MEALYEQLQALEEGLGDFVCSGCLKELPLPGLFIKNVGDISLPVQEEQVKKIITVAKKAPFGLGEKTVVDESVRKGWQLDPKQITIKNNLFNQGVKKVVATVKDQLGCNKKAVKAHLYKVLLYETGGHFKAHRDTEKEKGMFATLIIQLPSAFKGGKLVVRHGGEEKEVKFDGEESLYFCKYAAHYSDCEHEITEIEKGYRLALVYSLCWSATDQAAPSADANAVLVQNVARILPTVCTEERKMFSWFLTHKYTSAGLEGSGVKALKGHDADVVKALQAANELLTEEQKLDFHITMVTRQLSKNGDYYGGRYGCKTFECSEEEEEVSIENGWYDLDGATSQMIVSVHVDIEEEVVNYRCPTNTTSEAYKNKFWGKAYEEDDTGPTGNEGATQTFWYRSCAIFAWPKGNAVQIMCESDVSGTVDWLAKEFTQVKALPDSHPSYQKAMAHLKYVLNFLISKPNLMFGGDRAVCSMLTILADLHTDAVELANKFLIDIMAKEVSSGNCYYFTSDTVIASLVHLAVVVGWQSISEAILKMFQLSPASQYGRWAVFLRKLLEKMNESKNKVGENKCLQSILVSLVDAVEAGALGKTLNSTDAITWVSKTAPLLFLVNDTELLNKWTNAVLLQSPNSSLLEKLIETLSTESSLVGASPFWLKLLQSRIDQLEKDVEQRHQPFSWKQNDAVIVGHPQVQTFLRGPTQSLKYQAFSSIGHARKWANTYFCQNRWYSSASSSNTYSANVTAAGAGSKSYVSIQKTRDWYDRKMAAINHQVQHLNKLQAMVNTCTNKDLTTEELEPAAKKRALSTICVD